MGAPRPDNPQMPDIEITIFGAGGNVVEHSIGPAQTATDAEIAGMVQMIEGGTPAYLAASLVKQHSGCMRVSDRSNGQDWWKCERCGSLWHELVQGAHWLPLSCPDRTQ